MAQEIKTLKTENFTIDHSSKGIGKFAQSDAIGQVTFVTIVSADLTIALTTPPVIGGTTPAAITGTNGVFNTNLKTPIIFPPSDSTTAIKFTKADGTTAILTIDSTNSRIGIGTTSPAGRLEVKATASNSVPIYRMTDGTLNASFYIGSSEPKAQWGTETANDLSLYTNNNNRIRIFSSGGIAIGTNPTVDPGATNVTIVGSLGVGTTAALTTLHLRTNDTTSGAVTDGLTVERTSSGTPSAGYGTNIKMLLKSSTTTQRLAATISARWNVETDASYKADLVFTVSSQVSSVIQTLEGLRLRANGSTIQMGFWGGTPIAKQTFSAYTANDQSTAYTAPPIILTDAASLTDLNTLRVAYENLRSTYEDVRSKLQATTFVA